MTSNPPPTTAAAPAPNAIELLWERYKSLANVVILAIVAALGINYAMTYTARKASDEKWSKFATSMGLERAYVDVSSANASLTEQLPSLDAANLKAELGKAEAAIKPYLHLALARQAILGKDWAEAEAQLAALEKEFPNHNLVRASKYPMQSRDFVKQDKDAPATPDAKPDEPQWKPTKEGSAVALMRAQIEAAKGYAEPAQFAKPQIPADATKVKFELSNNYGTFTIALLPQAPLHREAFLKLAQGENPFWKGLAIDEIRRPTKTMKKLPHELHFGLASTKDDDRTKWNEKEPSTNLVEFEKNSLSHFAGAVSARNEADGKSCADRLWISVDDTPRYDGERVVFAWVVDGLDNLKKVCEATMSAQEEEQGRGKPSDNIRITAVTVLQ
ncbi:MAG: peptidylprolyl isomerase [Planctomycetota bacterium]|jgi:cyclophilin family peptidyl-prolyl cis-trans isomerase